MTTNTSHKDYYQPLNDFLYNNFIVYSESFAKKFASNHDIIERSFNTIYSNNNIVSASANNNKNIIYWSIFTIEKENLYIFDTVHKTILSQNMFSFNNYTHFSLLLGPLEEFHTFQISCYYKSNLSANTSNTSTYLNSEDIKFTFVDKDYLNQSQCILKSIDITDKNIICTPYILFPLLFWNDTSKVSIRDFSLNHISNYMKNIILFMYFFDELPLVTTIMNLCMNYCNTVDFKSSLNESKNSKTHFKEKVKIHQRILFSELTLSQCAFKKDMENKVQPSFIIHDLSGAHIYTNLTQETQANTSIYYNTKTSHQALALLMLQLINEIFYTTIVPNIQYVIQSNSCDNFDVDYTSHPLVLLSKDYLSKILLNTKSAPITFSFHCSTSECTDSFEDQLWDVERRIHQAYQNSQCQSENENKILSFFQYIFAVLFWIRRVLSPLVTTNGTVTKQCSYGYVPNLDLQPENYRKNAELFVNTIMIHGINERSQKAKQIKANLCNKFTFPSFSELFIILDQFPTLPLNKFLNGVQSLLHLSHLSVQPFKNQYKHLNMNILYLHKYHGNSKSLISNEEANCIAELTNGMIDYFNVIDTIFNEVSKNPQNVFIDWVTIYKDIYTTMIKHSYLIFNSAIQPIFDCLIKQTTNLPHYLKILTEYILKHQFDCTVDDIDYSALYCLLSEANFSDYIAMIMKKVGYIYETTDEYFSQYQSRFQYTIISHLYVYIYEVKYYAYQLLTTLSQTIVHAFHESPCIIDLAHDYNNSGISTDHMNLYNASTHKIQYYLDFIQKHVQILNNTIQPINPSNNEPQLQFTGIPLLILHGYLPNLIYNLIVFDSSFLNTSKEFIVDHNMNIYKKIVEFSKMPNHFDNINLVINLLRFLPLLSYQLSLRCNTQEYNSYKQDFYFILFHLINKIVHFLIFKVCYQSMYYIIEIEARTLEIELIIDSNQITETSERSKTSSSSNLFIMPTMQSVKSFQKYLNQRKDAFISFLTSIITYIFDGLQYTLYSTAVNNETSNALEYKHVFSRESLYFLLHLFMLHTRIDTKLMFLQQYFNYIQKLSNIFFELTDDITKIDVSSINLLFSSYEMQFYIQPTFTNVLKSLNDKALKETNKSLSACIEYMEVILKLVSAKLELSNSLKKFTDVPNNLRCHSTPINSNSSSMIDFHVSNKEHLDLLSSPNSMDQSVNSNSFNQFNFSTLQINMNLKDLLNNYGKYITKTIPNDKISYPYKMVDQFCINQKEGKCLNMAVINEQKQMFQNWWKSNIKHDISS